MPYMDPMGDVSHQQQVALKNHNGLLTIFLNNLF